MGGVFVRFDYLQETAEALMVVAAAGTSILKDLR